MTIIPNERLGNHAKIYQRGKNEAKVMPAREKIGNHGVMTGLHIIQHPGKEVYKIFTTLNHQHAIPRKEQEREDCHEAFFSSFFFFFPTLRHLNH